MPHCGVAAVGPILSSVMYCVGRIHRSLRKLIGASMSLLSAAVLVAVTRSPLLPSPAQLDYQKAMDSSEHEQEYLQEALRKNPRLADATIAFAALLEQQGDVTGGRRELLSLAQRDRRFRPRWALLNLEARQSNARAFWELARSMVPMSFGDHRPLLDLMWSMRPEGAFLAAQLREGRPSVQMDLTELLMEQGDLRTARAVFARLAAMPYENAARRNAGPLATLEERRQRGLDLCDLHLDRRQGEGAWEVWRVMKTQGLLDSRPTGRGFDWRIRRIAGVDIESAAAGWRIEFQGQQADEAELLARFHWRRGATMASRVSAAGTQGLEWRTNMVADGLALTQLFYQRKPGMLPVRGTVWIPALPSEREFR